MPKHINYLKISPDEKRLYLLDNLPSHLAIARQLSRFHRLLTNFEFIEAKTLTLGVSSLIADYDLTLSNDLTLNRLQNALQLSAHILVQDKTQLRSQLYGRLITYDTSEILAILGQIKEGKKVAWLRPLLPSLTSPERGVICTLTGHTNSVSSVVVTPDGQHIISGSFDHTLKIWNLKSGTERHTLIGHTDWVWDVVVTPDGHYVVSASADRTLKVWDLETKTEKYTLTGHHDAVRAVAITPNGEKIISASSDQTLKVWDLKSGLELCTLSGHTGTIVCVTITPDGRQVISASSDHTIKIWDIERGVETGTLQGHRSDVNHVVITPNGERIVSTSDDGTVKIWGLATQAILQTFDLRSAVDAIIITPDGQRMIVARSTIQVRELETGQELHDLAGDGWPTYDLTITPDGKRLITASYNLVVRILNLENLDTLHPPQGHNSDVTIVAVAPDGELALSASLDSQIKIWDLQTGLERVTFKGHRNFIHQAVFVANGQQVASAAIQEAGLLVWAVKDGVVRHKLQHSEGITTMATALDGQHAVSRSLKIINVWDLVRGVALLTLTNNQESFGGQVALTPDGQLLILSLTNNELRVWHVEKAVELYTITGHSQRIIQILVTSDGKRVVSMSSDKIILWDLQHGKILQTLPETSASYAKVAITPNGQHIIFGSSDGTLHMWDLENEVVLHTLKAHQSTILNIIITADGKRIISTATDNYCNLWDVETGELITSFIGESWLLGCGASFNGETIIAGDQSGRVHILQLERAI